MFMILKRLHVYALSFALIFTHIAPAMESFALPQNYNDWQYVKHIPGNGGGDGVHLFLDPISNKNVVIKDDKNQFHLMEEIVGRATYEVFDHRVPKGSVLDRHSPLWPKAWNERFPDSPCLHICEFIEGEHGKGQKLMRWFDVLFGNFDLASHNYIIENGQAVPVDFGCFARFRANGLRKNFEDLWSYRFIPAEGMIPPTEQELIDFKAHLPSFYEMLLDFHRKMNIPLFPSLWGVLSARIHSFLLRYDANPPVYLADRPVIEGQSASGILFFSMIQGKPCVFLGQRRQDNRLSDLGGNATATDRTLSRTAWREAIEELGGFKQIPYSDLENAPFIDYEGDTFYRMHLLWTDPFLVEDLMNHFNNQTVYKLEHLGFRWVPVEELFQLQDLHEPMSKSLGNEHARRLITEFALGNKPHFLPKGTAYSGQQRIGNYTYPVLKLELLNPIVFHARANGARLLRNSFKQSEEPLNLPLTASEAFLMAHLQDQYSIVDENGNPNSEENIKKLLAQKSDYFKSKAEEIDKHLPLVQSIVHQEKQFPNHFASVHASQGDFGVLWLIADIIRRELFLNDPTCCLAVRLYDSAFSSIATLDDHLKDINPQESQADDYKKGGQARILPVNFSPFLSLGRPNSETLSLFLRGESVRPPQTPRAILLSYLREALRLPEMAVAQVMLHLDPLFKDAEKIGALFQLFFPQEQAHKYVYLSHPGGARVILKEQKAEDKPVNSPVEYLKLARNNPKDIGEFLGDMLDFNLIQGRIMVHPEMLFGEGSSALHSIIYFSDGRSVPKLFRQLLQIVEVLRPHLHLALSFSTYLAPPRLVQLYNVITGSKADEIPAELAKLREIASKEGKSSSAVEAALEDPIVAKMETYDPLTLKRERALDLSNATSSIADQLLQFMPTVSSTEWSERIKMLATKYKSILDYFRQEFTESYVFNNGNTLAPIMKIDWENADFYTIRSMIQDQVIKKYLQSSGDIGDTLVLFYQWGVAMSNFVISYFNKIGMFPNHPFFNGQMGLLQLKEIHPSRIFRVVSSLLKEKELKVVSEVEIGKGHSKFIDQLSLVARVAKAEIREIKKNLRRIFKTLNVTEADPIDFENANSLLDLLAAHEGRWDEISQTYIDILKEYTSPLNTEWAIRLIIQHGTQLDSIMQKLKNIGYLTVGQKLFYQTHLIQFLADSPLNLERNINTLSRLYSQKLSSPYLLTRVLDHLDALPDQTRTRAIELLRDLSEEISDPVNVYPVMDNFIRLMTRYPNRLEDLRMIQEMAFRTNSSYPDIEQTVEWAMSLHPDQFAVIPLFLSLGLGSQHSQFLPDICQHQKFIQDNITLLEPIMRAFCGYQNGTDPKEIIIEAIKDQKLTVPVMEVLSKLSKNQLQNFLGDKPILDVLHRITQLPLPFGEIVDIVSVDQYFSRNQNAFFNPKFYDDLDKAKAALTEHFKGEQPLTLEGFTQAYRKLVQIAAYVNDYRDLFGNIYDLALNLAQHNPEYLKFLDTSREAWSLNQDFTRLVSDLVKGFPKTVCLIPLLGQYSSLANSPSTSSLLTMNDPSLLQKILGEYLSKKYGNRRYDQAQLDELLHVVLAIDSEKNQSVKEEKIELVNRFLAKYGYVSPYEQSQETAPMIRLFSRSFDEFDFIVRVLHGGQLNEETEADVESLLNKYCNYSFLTTFGPNESVTREFLSSLQVPGQHVLEQPTLSNIFGEFSKFVRSYDYTFKLIGQQPETAKVLYTELWRLSALYPQLSDSVSLCNFIQEAGSLRVANILRNHHTDIDTILLPLQGTPGYSTEYRLKDFIKERLVTPEVN